MKGFLEPEEAEQVVRKELSARSIEQWQLLRIGIAFGHIGCMSMTFLHSASAKKNAISDGSSTVHCSAQCADSEV